MASRSSTAYHFIAGALRRDIIRGVVPAGEKIASEGELCTAFPHRE